MRPLKLAAALAAVTMSVSPALAQSPPGPMPGHPHLMLPEGALLTVTAEGEVQGAPDLANINLGVVTEGQTAQAAVQAHPQRMNALMASLRRASVADRDVQTANLSVNPHSVYGEGVAPRITSYQASNNVNVRVRALNNLGRIMDAAVAAGGNTVNGVSFAFADPEPRLDQARTQAMQKARARADLYARAAGMSVNRIVSISEGGGMAPPMPVMAMARMAAEATPVAPGEVKASASVTVVYELR
jgi:uncharacterized protein YggE